MGRQVRRMRRGAVSHDAGQDVGLLSDVASFVAAVRRMVSVARAVARKMMRVVTATTRRMDSRDAVDAGRTAMEPAVKMESVVVVVAAVVDPVVPTDQWEAVVHTTVIAKGLSMLGRCHVPFV